MASNYVLQNVNNKLFKGSRGANILIPCCQIASRIKQDGDEEEFRLLNLYRRKGDTAENVSIDQRRKTIALSKYAKEAMPRYRSMSEKDNWTNIWPAASNFRWATVPIPVRMGYNKHKLKLKPEKYANPELVKIPNFLHLTPLHIQRHCEALKKFCTKFPEKLKNDEVCDTLYPVEVVTRNYITSGNSIQDFRSRKVTVNVKLDQLDLDDHAKEKMRKLAGNRIDKKFKFLELTSDRCPLKKQNYDFNMYTLTALFYESWVTEPWEEEQEEEDWESYRWDETQSKEKILKLKQKIHSTKQVKENVQETQLDTQDTDSGEDIQSYRAAISKMHDTQGSQDSWTDYKEAVLKLLQLNKST